MRTYDARLTEIHMEAGGQVTAWIDCPQAAIPAAGQYVFAYAPGDPLAVMGYPLFRGETGNFADASSFGETAGGGFLDRKSVV